MENRTFQNVYGRVETLKQQLSFMQNIDEQITACRRLLSTGNTPPETEACLSCVNELETLLWGKLRKDEEYLEVKEKILKKFSKILESLPSNTPNRRVGEKMVNIDSFSYWQKNKARQIFRELLTFCTKKKIISYGVEE
jgi:hypothetical protein